ncbi:MAG: hypothetical protein EXR72_27310 [Myxococcales bacterium]|nr:hypothetical protein [Myxococcales bacterium]
MLESQRSVCGSGGGACAFCAGLMPYNACVSSLCLHLCNGCYSIELGTCEPGTAVAACGVPYFFPGNHLNEGYCKVCRKRQKCVAGACQ